MSGVVSRDGRMLYMTTGRGKTVAVVDLASARHTASIEVGERPWGIAYSDDQQMLFTANGPSDDVSFIDIVRRTVTSKVRVSLSPPLFGAA